MASNKAKIAKHDNMYNFFINLFKNKKIRNFIYSNEIKKSCHAVIFTVFADLVVRN